MELAARHLLLFAVRTDDALPAVCELGLKKMAGWAGELLDACSCVQLQAALVKGLGGLLWLLDPFTLASSSKP